MVFRVLFLFEGHVQQRWHLTAETLRGLLLEERKLNIGCTKIKNYIVSGCITGFLIICEAKSKKNVKTLTYLGSLYSNKNARMGGSCELLLFASDLKYCAMVSFHKKA